MRIIFFILIIKALVFAQNVMLPESTVAVVNGTAISEAELEREVAKLLPKTYFHSTVNEEKLTEVRKKALESLIEHTLMYSYAVSKGIKASNDEVEDIVDKLVDFYGSQEKLEAVLKQNKTDMAELRQAIRRDLTLKQLFEKEIEYKITDEDLKKYYEENKFKFKEPEKIKAALIYVRNDPGDPKGREKALEKIKKAEQDLKNGENFPYVAQTYSDDPTRVKGGDLGFIHRGRLDMDIEDIAFSMDANTTSDIIEKDIGYFIVKVDEKKEPNQLSFEDVKKKLRVELKAKEEEKREKELLEKLQANAKIIK